MDDVPVVDGRPPFATQPLQSFGQLAAIPDLQMPTVDPHLHSFPDQLTGQRVEVVANADSGVAADPLDLLRARFQLPLGQLAQHLQLFGYPCAPQLIATPEKSRQKLSILRPRGKLATAPQ